MSAGWTEERLPHLSGRTRVVTGANRGIGYEAARELARKGPPDRSAATRLWEVSEQLTGRRYAALES